MEAYPTDSREKQTERERQDKATTVQRTVQKRMFKIEECYDTDFAIKIRANNAIQGTNIKYSLSKIRAKNKETLVLN